MSKVLRGGPPPAPEPPPTGKRIPAAVWDAEHEAARVVADARAEAEALRASAAADGRREGLEAAAAALVAAEAARARALTGLEPEIVDLALAIARKVLAAEVALGPDAVARIASEALGSARLGRAVVVRLHPDDERDLAPAHAALAAAAALREGLVLRADPTLSRGDCVVESELGTIDARLDTQLAAIAAALRGAGGRG